MLLNLSANGSCWMLSPHGLGWHAHVFVGMGGGR
jgi:hypothetical protein